MINIKAENKYKHYFGHLSRISGIDVDTIHYYQDVGLIKKSIVENPMDTGTTVRYFKIITRARKFGFSVNEIKKILDYFK